MRVAIITPYFQEPREWLERCLASVRRQTVACEHFVVADGHPQAWLDGAGVRHVRLDRGHDDYGNTPRAIGGQLAVSEGFDAVAFLDADNWFDPQHVATCLEAALRTHADVITARRRWVRADGSYMPITMGEDDDGSHVDTNCFFLMFGAFHTIPRWLLMPKPMTIWSDRFYLASLREEGLREAATERATVNYLCTWAAIFRSLGETPPPYAKEGLPHERLAGWISKLRPGDLAHVRRLSGCSVDKVLHRMRAA